jgi:stage II sporulation protein D
MNTVHEPCCKKRLYLTAVIVLLLSLSVVTFTPAIASSATISVGISTGESSSSFSAGKGTFSITAASGEMTSFKSVIKISASNAGMIVAGSKKMKLPVTIKSQSMINWNGRPYRGHLRLVQDGRGFTVVNVIEVEDYLKGVLKMEVNPSWPMEVLKAQAVIARTYALRNRNKHGSAGYDICATSHCQVYRGVNAEDPVLNRAVDSTRGMVLKYQGELAATFYHSDSGGHTADVSTVWSSAIPYLMGKPEPIAYESPYSNWQVKIPLLEIQRVLSAKGVNVGNLSSIEIASADGAGRAEMIMVSGSSGRVTLKSSQFRTFMGPDRIKSTFFRIGEAGPNLTTPAIQNPGPSSVAQKPENVPLSPQDEQLLISLTKNGVFNSEELMDMLIKPEKRGYYLRIALERQSGCSGEASLPKSQQAPSKSAGNTVVFTGRGWGHGVGLSQYGAKSLSEAGWDHPRILQHYFPGTRLEKISN